MQDDHVPPKNLFPPPRPSSLVTVPACSACNQGASEDDEYFRLILTLREDVFDNEAVQRALPVAMRGLRRPPRRKFRAHFLRGIKTLKARTPSGLFLARVHAYEVDGSRLSRVCARTIRGLYFRKFGKALPPDAEVDVWSPDGFPPGAFVGARKYLELRLAVLESEPTVIHPQVFKYWARPAADNEVASAWVLHFYDKIEFLGMTTPAE